MATASRTYLSDLSQLAAMREFVGETCRRHWSTATDEAAIRQLELALQEAAANVVEHAYQDDAGHPIVLTLETLPDQIRVTLTHSGLAFDPASAAPPVFDGSSEGGFGVYMMEHLVDRVAYFQVAEGRSAVCLVKHRTPSAQE